MAWFSSSVHNVGGGVGFGGGGDGGAISADGGDGGDGGEVDGVVLDATVNPQAMAAYDAASEGGTQVTNLYRAVSEAEAQDIQDYGGFRPAVNGQSYQGKLFATSAEDAARFGRINFKLSHGTQPFFIVEADVPTSLATSYYHDTMDRMPAVAVYQEELPQLNSESLIQILDYVPR